MAIVRLWQMTTIADRLLIALLLSLGIFSFVIQTQNTTGTTLVIEGPDGLIARSPLSESTSFIPTGHNGKTVVTVISGSARVVSSACPLKICVAQGSIDRTGELIACVPNGIIVYIEGEQDSEGQGYDHISR